MADTAPLIETPQARAPAGGEAAWFSGAGGARLRAALFTPRGPTRGSIILSGGRTEVIEKYYEFIRECLDRGFVVLAHDWRGQGLSHRELGDPLKGHARGYRVFLDDFQALLGAYGSRLPKPWIAVGHSMGGCLTLLAMTRGENRFAGAILSAPMLGLRTPLPLILSQVLTGLSLLAGRRGDYTMGGPGAPFDTPFEGNVLTHDPVRFARTASLIAAEPKLALGAPTWGWIDFALRATAYLARPDRLSAVGVPVTIVSAQEDRLVDGAALTAAARHLPQGTFVSVPGAYHELLMETDPMRNIFLRAFDALTGRVAPPPVEAAKPAPPPAPAAPAPAPVAVEMPAPVAAKAVVKRKPAARKPAAKKAPAKPAAAKAPVAAKAPRASKPAAKSATANSATPRKAPAKPPAARKAAVPTPARKPVAKTAAAPKAMVAQKPLSPVKTLKAPKAPAARGGAGKGATVRKTATTKPPAKKPPAKR
ncbi:alpha/beta hydrolase [Phenylobacterium sp.]|uniref:alpha/beta hydrolase n=1 Tax=Phenylobacterium sp. TaxID=1871053 RepID=UPI00286BCA69|nr:alpha/beta hydrolase [Phenylobacterium sp.]